MDLTFKGSLVELKPATLILPEVGSVRPRSISIIVDFPAPLGPSSPNISPSLISRLRWSTAVVVSLYTLVSSSATIMLLLLLIFYLLPNLAKINATPTMTITITAIPMIPHMVGVSTVILSSISSSALSLLALKFTI